MTIASNTIHAEIMRSCEIVSIIISRHACNCISISRMGIIVLARYRRNESSNDISRRFDHRSLLIRSSRLQVSRLSACTDTTTPSWRSIAEYRHLSIYPLRICPPFNIIQDRIDKSLAMAQSQNRCRAEIYHTNDAD